MGIYKTMRASKVVFDCGGELYHLECARRKHGDEAVLCHLRTFYSQQESLSPSNASIRAGQFLNDVDRLKTHGFDFKHMRENLAHEHCATTDGANHPSAPILA